MNYGTCRVAPATDSRQLPDLERFAKLREYLSTLWHRVLRLLGKIWSAVTMCLSVGLLRERESYSYDQVLACMVSSDVLASRTWHDMNDALGISADEKTASLVQ